MRVGDFGVELIPIGEGALRETDSGHVLARPGTVYGIRLRNFGPLRAVAEIRIDNKSVTENGLVLDANGVMTLERPVHESETGRFTVIAEGNEAVFGADGGRDNASLGAIVASFRRELPQREVPYLRPRSAGDEPRPIFSGSNDGSRAPFDIPIPPPPFSPRPMSPPGWSPPTASARMDNAPRASASLTSQSPEVVVTPPPRAQNVPIPATPAQDAVPTTPTGAMPTGAIERAAGTGLTGHSSQGFVSVHVGALETEATVIRLRLVIGTEAALNAPRPLRDVEERDAAPARPLARP
jgi:hypothetical protein